MGSAAPSRTPPTAIDASDEVVNHHYERYPFPKADELFWKPRARWIINGLTGRWSHAPLPASGRVLVAGCGTREALVWAGAFPDAEIYAVDLSEASIAISSRLARQLGVKNLHLEQRTLLSLSPADGEFDFISSYGVLHHLEDPKAGLRILRDRLTPAGVLGLMLYSRRNRHLVQDLQSLIATLGGSAAHEREAMAKALTLDWDASTGRLAPVVAKARDHLENDWPLWADAFVHPRERAYDLDELFDLLEEEDLRFLSWQQPFRWHLPALASQAPFSTALASLPDRAKYRVVDLVRAPLFELYCGRADGPAPDKPWFHDDELLLESVLVTPRTVRHAVEENRVTRRLEDGRALGVVDEDPSAPVVRLATPGGLYLDTHRFVAGIVSALDGERTLREVASARCEQSCLTLARLQPVLLDVVRRLIEPHGALALRPPPLRSPR